MYAKGKGSTVPSDAQAREKLALYVYEYLLHVGAQKAAQTFLSEIRWEKNITLGEPPGFLHSWWCVFWDLYCAAPERRDTCDHSSEAKAFHDYGFVNSGYGVNGIAHVSRTGHIFELSEHALSQITCGDSNKAGAFKFNVSFRCRATGVP
ncbi:Single-stranded DNA-binding protein 3 [Daphnia magna]|uniref:Single-stranded DNA-binding protein 3 n=1 Tax=Daphnia magna TaxID=35525 RepID=A0A164XFA8_9CRUS|nr:Single-stranded DNA-binding protein 3 [Daphnia magna]